MENNLTNILKSTPLEPHMHTDGWYTTCVRCHEEITPEHDICPHCNQVQDWSWFRGSKNEE